MIDDRAYTFEVPDVGTWRNEKRLTWLTRVSKALAIDLMSSKLTAIDIKQIEHSDECVEVLSESLVGAVFPRLRSRLCV